MKNHSIIKAVVAFLAVLLPAAAFAGVPVKGVVNDASGYPLIGVMVYEPGTSNGSMTDIDGNYTLTVSSDDAKIAFSSMGYLEHVENVAGRAVINVTLQDDTQTLDEVVVVGYGVQKKGTMTGSVASVSTEALTKAPTDNVSNMLGGKLPGLVSRQTSGLPGENQADIYIRGVSTTGSSSPLVLVDGVERDFSNLDPSEIANITILKDAASAAVYGVKGANGVILVTTKRGDAAQTTITYNGAMTFSQNADMIELLDGPSYAYWHNLASDLDGIARQYSDLEIGYIKNGNDPQGVMGNTDWLDLIFKDVAVGHNHNVSITGGTDKVRYFVGGSALNQDGIISDVWFRRYNLRSNIDIELTDRLSVKLDVSGRIENRHQPGVSAGASDPTASLDNGGAEYGYKNIIFYAISARPTINPQMPDGTYIGYQNPLIARDHSGFNKKNNSYVQTSATISYKIPGIEGLTAKGLFSYDFQNTLQKKLTTPYLQITPQYGTRGEDGFLAMTPGNSPHSASGINQLTESHNLFSRFTYTLQLNYANNFGKHDVGADLVWEQSGTNSRSFSASKQNFAITEIPDLNFSTEVTPNSVTGSHTDTGRQGLLFRGNYTYDNKYMVQASIRGDWSAKFAKNNRLGIFPAVSAGWKISEEDFMASTRGVLDNLKLRASYGILGNDAISDFLYLQGIALSSKPTAVINGVPTQSLSTSSVPNRDITWETTTTYNIGVDASFWNRLLSIEADAFYKVTTDILQSQAGQMPPSIGGNYSSIINGGVIDVRGFEVVLGHSNKVGEFSYNVSANASFARNRYISTNDSDNIPSYQSKIGQPLGGVLGYVSDGLFQSEEEIAASPLYNSGVRVGDIKYKDLNGDGKITAEDRTWIAGSQLPEVMFGLNFDFEWKGFDFSMFFQGATNTEIMLCGTYSALGFSDGTYYTQAFKWGSNPPKYLVEGSWRPDNTGAQYPRLSTQSSNNNVLPSDFWKRDASYVRLKNLQLGYTLPSKVTDRLKVQNLRVYFSANNLFTVSALSKIGIDPEAPSVNNGYYPQQRMYSFGLSLTF
ncbi:MAG: TonB-dependent receptor [Bacteroidales bacterium]|nr:TonB-dependent receptor [Bacteroidales bacterium]